MLLMVPGAGDSVEPTCVIPRTRSWYAGTLMVTPCTTPIDSVHALRSALLSFQRGAISKTQVGDWALVWAAVRLQIIARIVCVNRNEVPRSTNATRAPPLSDSRFREPTATSMSVTPLEVASTVAVVTPLSTESVGTR